MIVCKWFSVCVHYIVPCLLIYLVDVKRNTLDTFNPMKFNEKVILNFRS